MAGIQGPFWKLRRDRSNQPKREPGPIDLQRYEAALAYAGIATFIGLPLALTPEDLRAGRVEVAIVGAPIVMSLGHGGAQYGPRYIRADERTLPHTPGMMMNPDTRIKPFEVLKVVDYSDPRKSNVARAMTPARRRRARRPAPRPLPQTS